MVGSWGLLKFGKEIVNTAMLPYQDCTDSGKMAAPYFSFILVQWEEVGACCPSLFMSMTETSQKNTLR